ncbi:MAG: hypothetical protein U5R46_17805 [Gammaproteobacteria bacterium]|nr:hypothetical protein [Gammaproteobacteria bacterium]
MRIKKLLASLGAASVFVGLAMPAQAALLIDFTDGLWTPPNDVGGLSTTRSFGGLEVTLEAWDSSGGQTADYTESNFDGPGGPGAYPECGFLACTKDGIGVQDDEVTYHDGGFTDGERLRVTFSKAVPLHSLIFLDLFGAPDDGADAEVAQVYINTSDGAGYTGTKNPGTTAGFFTGDTDNDGPVTDIGSNAFVGVTTIDFFADSAGSVDGPTNSDFALAGIRVVPIPAALPLLGYRSWRTGHGRAAQKETDGLIALKP